MSFSAQNLIAKEIFGVDPGFGGAISKYSKSGIETTNMPRDFDDLCDFWRGQKDNCENPIVFLEKISSFNDDFDIPKSKEEKNKKIGKLRNVDKLKTHYVELRSSLRSSRIPFIEIMPFHWQNYLHIHISGEDYNVRKRRYKDIATEMFPQIKVSLKNCDALLLIEFAKRKLKYEPLWVIQKTKKK